MTPEPLPASDLLSDLFTLLDECGSKMVFWVCDDPTHRGVKWNEARTDAECLVCGRKRSDNAVMSHSPDQKA